MMNKLLLAAAASLLSVCADAATIKVTIDTVRCQRVTGFGAAACSGLMAPIQDTKVIDMLYGPDSKVGLNIMRMEISPNLIGDVTTPWDTPYDWHGYLPVAKRAKEYGTIIFGTPWSPPAVYKTNNSASGGEGDDHGNLRGKLKAESYSKFFVWLNTFCAYMQNNNAAVDIVAIQNEPDWWVGYSGCLYTPTEMYNLVKSYASRLDKAKYNVRLMGGESFYFNPTYTDSLLNYPETSQHIDLIGGHIYGNPPLGNMAKATRTAAAQGKETWMTEHSVNPRGDNGSDIVDLPTWHEELLFAEELNESMQAGISAYVYWYMVAHWSFVGSGDKTIQPGNDYGTLLRRGLIMSHFSKHLPGATRLSSKSNVAIATNAPFEQTAYIKGDSLIVVAIDTTKYAHDLQLNLPYMVKSGKRIISTEENVCKEETLVVPQPAKQLTFDMPARSLTTYIFTIDWTATGIDRPVVAAEQKPGTPRWYNMQGQRVEKPGRGVYICNGKKMIK